MKILSEIANEHDRKTIIFVETKRRADEITRTINRRGFNAVSIHGDKSQSERDYTLNSFRSGRMNVQILVATDVASRGLGEFQCPKSPSSVETIFYQSEFHMAEISRFFPQLELKNYILLRQLLFICRIFSRFLWENLNAKIFL